MEFLRGSFLQIDAVLWNFKVLDLNIRLNGSLATTNLPDKLPNLERIYLNEATTEQILPFICRSSKLMTIKIGDFSDNTYLRHGFVDLMALSNKEREKSRTATKWANKPTQGNLLELRRFASIEWRELNSDFQNCHRWSWLKFTYDFIK